MKNKIIAVVIILVLATGGWFYFRPRGDATAEVEFRYSPVAKGELMRSISATGLVVALTTVDVKSKAGGKVVQLAVDEGSVVRRGDLIAVIDPADTQAVYDQANADLTSATARAQQARSTYELQVAQSRTAISDATAALEAAKARLERAAIEARVQPALSQSAVQSAQAAYDAATTARDRMRQVTVPQMKRDAAVNLDQLRTAKQTADAELARQVELEKRGFVAGSSVERARSAAAVAGASLEIAQQRFDTITQETDAMLREQDREVDRTLAQLDQAKANGAQVDVRRASLDEARKAVRTAEINLQRARDAVIQNAVRQSEVQAAQASTVRSRVSVQNARVQLDSTTVIAPRDGVVTMKYLEEGTIIPPGTSTFAQGTSIVQISDVAQLFVECAVDEADIGAVKVGQSVRIVTEAFPGQQFRGIVTRVNPAAVTAQNITAVKVRVRVLPGAGVNILPGMNATCEFITLNKPDVLIVPGQAVQQEEGRSFVRVKSADPKKPVRKEIQVGESGNDGIEVLSGLTEGEEVVTAEIDLAALREIQKKMVEAQQGGGLAGGGPQGRFGGRGTGGGARPGGGGGGAPR